MTSGPEYILDRAGCPRQRRTALAAKANDPQSRSAHLVRRPICIWVRSSRTDAIADFHAEQCGRDIIWNAIRKTIRNMMHQRAPCP